MILQKADSEIASEIQVAFEEKGYPVKVYLTKPEAGADIGIKLYIALPRDWSIEKEISSIVWKVLDRYGLIAYIEKVWSSSGADDRQA